MSKVSLISISDPRKILALLGGSRLQHGDLAETGPVPAVLLVLRAVLAGVVGHDNHKAALHPGVGDGHQGVGSHVQTHMLHAGNGPSSGQRRAVGHFQRHLLVGRPLCVHLGVGRQLRHDLAARRARIGAADNHTGLPGAPGNRLIALQYFFHFILLPQNSIIGSLPAPGPVRLRSEKADTGLIVLPTEYSFI